MLVGTKERPTFFEIFKARCSKADLGPISLNWFEELSLEAPPYRSEPAEESEYKISSYEPNHFKTPQRKPYDPLASTPVIFKDQGTETANSKQRSRLLKRARMDPAKDATSPPPNLCLSGSPLLRAAHVTPQRAKSVVCGNLFHTPKLLKGQTPKRISESLGAEVDPDMSWSSSLATPPTLSSTVLIAREQEVSELVFPNDATVASKDYFSNRNESLKKNDWLIPSGSDNENINQREVISYELGETLGNLFGDVNSHQDHSGRSVSNVIEEEVQERVADISKEDSFSLCVHKYKTGKLQKLKTRKTREKVLNKTKAGDCEEAEPQLHGRKHLLSFVMEPSDSDPCDSAGLAQEPTGGTSGARSQELRASPALEWSQLMLSAPNLTQMTKMLFLPDPSFDQNDLGKGLIGTQKGCVTLVTAENSPPHLSSLRNTEAVLSEDPVLEESNEEKCVESNQDFILPAKPTVSGTSPITSPLQSIKKLVCKIRESPKETSGVDSSGYMTDPSFKEKPETSAGGLEADLHCSQREGLFCASSAANRSCPTTTRPASAILKSTGLISTLKQKTRKFVYSVSDETSYPEEQIQRDEDPEPPHCPAQVGVPCRIPDALHSPVKRSNLQSRPEEPTLSSCVDPILRKSSNHESSSNKIISQDLNDKEIELNTEELESFITTESDSLSCLQESYCEEDPKNDRRISNVKEMVLVASCRPAIECGSVHLHSQESFLHDHNTSTLILTPSPKEPVSNPAMISRESRHNICEATFMLTKNILVEKNQEISILNDNSQIVQLSPPEKYLKVTSPSLKVQFDQNTTVMAIPKDQEEITFTSEVTVCSNSEELFPENKDNFVFQTSEKNMAVLEDAKEHHETSVSCVKEPAPKHPTVVAYSDMDAKQAVQVLAPQDSNSSNIGLNLSEEARKSKKQYLKKILSQDLKTDLSLELARKSSRNDDVDSCVGLSCPISNCDFGGGFRTASNKEIKLSEHHIKKSKALFKDIEEQYPKSLTCVEVANTLLLDNKKKLDKPHAWDSQTINTVSGDAQDCENSHTAPYTLSLQQDLNSNHNLTPSQKAEITELSTILEQSGSQFEFTQFRKPNHRLENHTFEKCENQMTTSNQLSEGWKDVGLDAAASAPLIKKVDGSKKSNGPLGDEQTACLMKNDCSKSASGYLKHKVECTGFCSALGAKINVSSEALQSVRSLFSDIEDTSEDASAEGAPQSFSPSEHTSIPLSKRTYLNKDENVNMKCHFILQNNVEITTGIFIKGNTRDWKKKIENEESKCTDARRNTYSSGKSDSDSSKTNTPGIHKDENGSPSNIGQHNMYLKLSGQLIKEGNNEKEDLSDLTCLEVVKTGEIVCVDTQTKDQSTNTKMTQNVKDFDMCNVPFQTASGKNIRVSKESLKKVANLFKENCAEEESNTFSDLFDSELPSGINVDKSGSENRKMVKNNIQKGSNPIGIENKLLVLHQQPKCGIEKTREPAMLGFHTASGKKVKIAKESLDKVKCLFDEEKQDDGTSKIFGFHPQGTKTLKETREYTEGLQLETVEVTTLPKSEEKNLLHDYERNFVSNETTGLLNEPFNRHTKSLKTSNSISLKVEVHQNLEKETAKSPIMCCTASENPAFAFCTGRGRKISVSQASLFEAKKWLREGESEDQAVDISTAKAICVKACPQDWVGNPPYGSSSNPVITENDKQNLSYLSNNSYSSDFCHSNEVRNKSGSLSKNKIDCSGIEPVMKNIRNRECTTSISEVTATARKARTPPHTVNENVCVQKLRTDAPRTSENAAIGFAMSGSSNFEVGPPAFSTASGKRVSISRKAIERAREILVDNSSEVVKPNTERQSDGYKTGIVGGSCRKALDHSEDDVFPSILDEGCAVHKVLDATQSEPSSQHNQQMSALDRVSEPAEVNGKMSDVRKFSIGTLPKSTSSNVCGIFSTASGKSVQVSDASLQKARQVFSELENHAEHLVSKASFKSHEHSNKVTGDKSHGIHTKAKSPPRPESFPSKVVSVSAAAGFSTASGKQVLISESALYKVKGMLEEFDLITAEYNLQSPPFISAASNILPLPSVENIPKEPTNSKEVRKTCNTEFQLLNIESGSSESPLETKASLVEKSRPLGKEQTLLRQVKMKIDNAPTFSNIPMKKPVEVTSACSKDPAGYFETEAVEIAKAFMEDEELTDLELPSHAKHSQFTCAKPKETVVLNSRTGKRRNTLVSAGEPPTKRSLLNEFDRIAEKQEKSRQASKSTPDGTMKDRRLFMHHISINPITCVPFCTTKERPEIRTPSFTAPGQQFLPRSHVLGHSALEKPSSSVSVSGEPLHRAPVSGRDGARAAVSAGRPAKVFVPPFKTKAHFQKKEQCAAGNVDVDENEHPQKNLAVPGAGAGAGMSGGGIHPLDQKDSSQAATVSFSTHEGEPLDVLASLQIARDAQEARIRMKQQQRVCPQPGSLYLAKTSSMPRVSLRAAVEGRAPAAYSPEQVCSAHRAFRTSTV